MPISKAWIAACFLLTLGVYLSFLPRFLRYCSPPTGDQAFYLMITASIAQDFDLDLRNNYSNRDEDKFYSLAPRAPDFVGMSAPYPLPQHLAESSARPPEEWYGFQYPGLPALLAPIWILGGWLSLWWPATVLFMCVIGALLGVQIFLLAYEVSHRRWVACAVWLALSFSNPLMTYSFLLFTELTTGLFLVYAFRRFALGWDTNGPVRLCAIGLAIGWIPWLAWRCVPLAASIGAYGFIQWWRHRRAAGQRVETESIRGTGPEPRPATLAQLALVFIPLGASAALLAAYNLFLFGELSPPTRVPELGPVAPFHWPWEGIESFRSFVTTAFALLFDVQWGLLPYAPVYLLVPLGLVALWQTRRGAHRLLALSLAILAPYLFVLVSYEIWTGSWCPPARFLTTFTPLAAVPLSASLRLATSWRRRLFLIVYALLGAWGWLMMALFMHDPRLIWPSSIGTAFEWIALLEPELHQLDLRRVLPSFIHPDEFGHPTQTAIAVGASMLILFLGSVLSRPGRNSSSSLAPGARSNGTSRFLSAWAAGSVVVAAGWLVMNTPYLKHKTLLVELRRWPIPAVLHDPRAIAYLDGRVYIACFGERFPDGTVGAGTLGELDLQTGDYRPVVLEAGGEPVAWAHPGDVKAVEGKFLYVLDNGNGDATLLVITPDGGIRRRIPLTGLALGMGLHVAPGGFVYVTDMMGGNAAKFSAEGGAAIASWRGIDRLLNNPSGIWADEDGSVFTTETFERVQQLSPDDRLIHQFDVGCKPLHFAVHPDGGPWLDLTCEAGLRSIHRRERFVQAARSAGKQPVLVAPTGVTYAPDGTLLVLDGSAIVALQITH